MKRLNKTQNTQNKHLQEQENAAPLSSQQQQQKTVKNQKNKLLHYQNIVFGCDSFENSFELYGNQHPLVIQANFQKYILILNEKQTQVYKIKKREKLTENILENADLQKLQTLLNNLKWTNSIFTLLEKNQFNKQLSRQGVLTKTIQELYSRCHEDLFLEFYYNILIIWKKFFQFAKKHCSVNNELKLFPCTLGVNNLDNILQKKDTDLQYAEISENQVLLESQRILPDLVNQLYQDCHIKLLKTQIVPSISPNINLKREFGAFIDILTKSVFLSSIEIYEHPDSQQQQKHHEEVDLLESGLNWSSTPSHKYSFETEIFNFESNIDL